MFSLQRQNRRLKPVHAYIRVLRGYIASLRWLVSTAEEVKGHRSGQVEETGHRAEAQKLIAATGESLKTAHSGPPGPRGP